MSSAEALYDTYLTAASSADQSERVRILSACATADFEIVSPFPYVVRGIEEVASKLGEVAGAQPGGELNMTRSTRIDEHNGVFRVAFENRDATGELLSTGMHIAETRDGRLARLLVFVPAALPDSID